MTKTKKSTETKLAKSGGPATGGVGGSTPTVEKPTPAFERRTPEEGLVVFAFRLTEAERELIHKAAGGGKASRFVRAVAVAAARGDEDAVLKLLGGPAPAIR
ncbi:MAG: hypothetical protein ABI960_03755 [Candidatus Eisenbacteria bacterium]